MKAVHWGLWGFIIVALTALVIAICLAEQCCAQWRVPHYSGRGYCSCAMCRRLYSQRQVMTAPRVVDPTAFLPDPVAVREWSQNMGGSDAAVVYDGFDSQYEPPRRTIPSDLTPIQGPPSNPQTAPTPHEQVLRMLWLAGPLEGKTVLDPGCGKDARLLVAAVRAGAESGVGIEILPEAAQAARQAVESAGLSGKIKIIEGDSRQVAWPNYDVCLVYLFPELLGELAPRMRGRKVVSYAHAIRGLKCVEHTERGEKIYVYGD